MFATITNITAYLPFLMLTGNTGEFLYSLPIVMACALVASRLVSMTFIPLLGYYLLRPNTKREPQSKSAGSAASPAHTHAWLHWPSNTAGRFSLDRLLLVRFPYLAKPGLPMILFRLLAALAFMSAVYAVSDGHLQWIIALCLMTPAAVLNVLNLSAHERIVEPRAQVDPHWRSKWTRMFLWSELARLD